MPDWRGASILVLLILSCLILIIALLFRGLLQKGQPFGLLVVPYALEEVERDGGERAYGRRFFLRAEDGTQELLARPSLDFGPQMLEERPDTLVTVALKLAEVTEKRGGGGKVIGEETDHFELLVDGQVLQDVLEARAASHFGN